MASFRVGLVQMCTGRDVARNLAELSRLVREAAAAGAQYIQTPEVSVLMERDRARLLVETRPEEGNPAVAHCRALARELGVWLHLGSMGVLVGPDKIANRSFLFSPEGRIAARYDKIHMFDVELPGGESYRESRNFEPGDKAVLAGLPWGTLGMTVCYDMRFPALYRALAKAGAELIAVPSAFTVPTGQAHWHALLRARAIEAQCFILAAAQAGAHESGRSTYGHSIVVSPWGEVLAEADGVETSVILANVELKAVEEARRRVPSLQHDRPFEVVRADTAQDSDAET
ncbi:MAG: carbon-nitrogen hydrolase family protein [Hyphomicrobiaceae bacterium]|nr:carbon-nitrogen hydrolase family protein [Hyphomicrobiaceae bacterium]